MAIPPSKTTGSLAKMGKTGRWFRGMLCGKRAVGAKEKKGWGFLRSPDSSSELRTPPKLVDVDDKDGVRRDRSCFNGRVDGGGGTNLSRQAMEVAKSGAAAAQAAMQVVSKRRREDFAAVKIQSVFRAYLARRALRALKGLVRLQALVRGYIVRKQALETLHCMHALVRVQARALASRTHWSQNPHLNESSSAATPEQCKCKSGTLKRNCSKLDNSETYEDKIREGGNLLDRWMDKWSSNQQRTLMEAGGTDDQTGKIPEIYPMRPLLHSKQQNDNLQSSEPSAYSFFTLLNSMSRDSTSAQPSTLAVSTMDIQSSGRLRYPKKADHSSYETADSSPQDGFSVTSKPMSGKRGPFTPLKSDCSQTFFGVYSSYPNYMAETKSSKAKVRSQSAPKQRLELEKCSSARRLSVHGCRDVSGAGLWQSSQISPLLPAKFGGKRYPGSGQLDRFGMPIGYSVVYRSRC